MVRALMASSFTPLSTSVAAPPLAGNSWATPAETILSRKSTMMRWAVFSPMPFTLLSNDSLPVAMVSHSSRGDIDERIILAVLAPTPETVSNNR